jgi:hypothetical protein
VNKGYDCKRTLSVNDLLQFTVPKFFSQNEYLAVQPGRRKNR